MLIAFPNVFAIDESGAENPIQQIGKLGVHQEGALVPFSRGHLRGFLFRPTDGGEQVLIIPKTRRVPDGHARVVEGPVNEAGGRVDLSNGRWLRHPLLNRPPGAIGRERFIQEVVDSWAGAFSYVQEVPDRGIVGLRNPQIGAVHAVHAHWCVSDAPATIVMPTGTGKTDTMLSVLVSARCSKLLVVVPTDALRTQLADRFLSLGILKTPRCTALRAGAKQPIVCTLYHI